VYFFILLARVAVFSPGPTQNYISYARGTI